MRAFRLVVVTFFWFTGAAVAQVPPRDWQEDFSWRGAERPKIGKIYLTGNQKFPTGLLREKLFSREASWLVSFGLARATRLQKDSRERDLVNLLYSYQSNGFLEARITERFGWDSTARRVDIWVEIGEGVQTKIGPVTVAGDTAGFSEKIFKLTTAMKSGEPFNPFVLEQTRSGVKTLLADNGYPYARVSVDTLRDSTLPNLGIQFRIARGQEVHFGRVTVEGLQYTRPHVATRELVFHPGDRFSREKIVSSQQRIYSTGLFTFVNLVPQSSGAGGDSASRAQPAQPDFILKLVERKPAFFGFKAGAGQYQQQEQQQDLAVDLGTQWGNRNLWGTARKYNIELKTSFLVINRFRILNNRIAGAYQEPWFLGTRTAANFTLSFEPGVQSAVLPYRIETITGGLSLVRELSLTTRLLLTGLFQHVAIFGITPENILAFKRDQGITIRRRVILSFERDTRDNIFIPLSGAQTYLSGELTGGPFGGDAEFFKLVANWARYRSLSGSNVFAVRVKAGYLEGLRAGSFIPASDRFFLGGGSSLRGYTENSLGPLSASGDPLGGRTLLLANGELRRPLFWKFWGSMFADVGNIWERPVDFSLGDLRITTGAGLQFLTVVGPIRIDYGRRVVRGAAQPGGRVHFSILYAF